MSLTRTSDPAREPIALSDARAHLRVEEDDEDAHIAGLIAAARDWAEGFTRRAFITQTWELHLDGFPKCIRVPRPPLQSVTSIQYVDSAGVSQTLSTSVYTVDTDAEPGLIYPAYSQTWPTTRQIPKSVTVTFVAGYGADPADVPDPIRHAIKLHVSRLYEIREPQITGTIITDTRADEAIARPYQIGQF